MPICLTNFTNELLSQLRCQETSAVLFAAHSVLGQQIEVHTLNLGGGGGLLGVSDEETEAPSAPGPTKTKRLCEATSKTERFNRTVPPCKNHSVPDTFTLIHPFVK